MIPSPAIHAPELVIRKKAKAPSPLGFRRRRRCCMAEDNGCCSRLPSQYEAKRRSWPAMQQEMHAEVFIAEERVHRSVLLSRKEDTMIVMSLGSKPLKESAC